MMKLIHDDKEMEEIYFQSLHPDKYNDLTFHDYSNKAKKHRINEENQRIPKQMIEKQNNRQTKTLNNNTNTIIKEIIVPFICLLIIVFVLVFVSAR